MNEIQDGQSVGKKKPMTPKVITSSLKRKKNLQMINIISEIMHIITDLTDIKRIMGY